jgi:IMP dehydrogenase/GMP reductase
MQEVENDSRYLRFETSGGTVVIESSEGVPGAGPVSQRGAIEDTGKRLETALEQLGEILAPLRAQVKKQLADAEQVTVEFGLKVTAGAGLIVAKSEFEGNFKISVVWKK